MAKLIVCAVGGTVQFMHQTVREFIIRTVPRAVNLKFEISDEAANRITTTLARYLMLFFMSPTLIMRNRFAQIESWSPEDYRAYAEYLDEWPLIDYALHSIKEYRERCNQDGSAAGLVTATLQKLTENQATYFLGSFVDLHTGGIGRQAIQANKYQATSQDIKYRTLNAAANPPLLNAVKALLTCMQEDSHTKGDTPLIISAKKGLPGATQVFLDQNFDVNTTDGVGRAALHCAAAVGHGTVARLLVDRGADVKAVDKGRWTPLHIAANSGHETVARLLVDRGANIEALDKGGWTPLHSAANNGHGAIARLLVDRGAGIEAVDQGGWTPLHFAAGNGHETVARLFVDLGADVKAVDKDGRTPLHFAAKSGHGALVWLLVNRGAKILATDKDGRTPLHSAAENAHEALAQLLVDRGHTVPYRLTGYYPLPRNLLTFNVI